MTLRLTTRIDPMSDDNGFIVSEGENRVAVYPPFDYDNFPKDGFIAMTEHDMSADKAREMARLLLVAADYLAAMQEKRDKEKKKGK